MTDVTVEFGDTQTGTLVAAESSFVYAFADVTKTTISKPPDQQGFHLIQIYTKDEETNRLIGLYWGQISQTRQKIDLEFDEPCSGTLVACACSDKTDISDATRIEIPNTKGRSMCAQLFVNGKLSFMDFHNVDGKCVIETDEPVSGYVLTL